LLKELNINEPLRLLGIKLDDLVNKEFFEKKSLQKFIEKGMQEKSKVNGESSSMPK